MRIDAETQRLAIKIADESARICVESNCIPEGPTLSALQWWPPPSHSAGGSHWLTEAIRYLRMRGLIDEGRDPDKGKWLRFLS